MSQILIGITRNRFAPIVCSRPLSLANIAYGRGRGGRPAPERPVEENRTPIQKIDTTESPQEIWTTHKLPGNPKCLYQAVMMNKPNAAQTSGMSEDEKAARHNAQIQAFTTTLQTSFSRRSVGVTGIVGMLCMSNLIIFPTLSIWFGAINAILYSGLMFSFSYGNQIARQPLRGLWFNEETGVTTVAVESYNFHKSKEANIFINIPAESADFDVGSSVKSLFAGSEIMEPPKNYFDRWGRTCSKFPFPGGICLLFKNVDLSASLVDNGHANTCVWIEPNFFKNRIYDPNISGNEEIFEQSTFFKRVLAQMRSS
ncbi:Oidioi.mRNA.OKI2018_I69.chr1.g2836.t1.cds [Oikopleura dioica]|uniref:Oidioi.mRNA.OKI2018_I69.chr1.g2836.t1.cds n=1 Tax=Oikopleura dioica TaxID=34765 RepID=A0ABN7SXL3_OIKDI|nr:Oidioi.mRNA.OKI2018_I69.chr1.g2836.t1.cds [Oikopleura dioica]